MSAYWRLYHSAPIAVKTQLLICIKSLDALSSKDLEFYTAEDWDADSELKLLHHIHELLSALRPVSRSVQVHLQIDANDFLHASNNLNKIIKKECVIKGQKLSMRELEILGLIMQGFVNKQIAEKLFISFETVKTHRKNILLKTGMHNTAALINHYHQTFFDK